MYSPCTTQPPPNHHHHPDAAVHGDQNSGGFSPLPGIITGIRGNLVSVVGLNLNLGQQGKARQGKTGSVCKTKTQQQPTSAKTRKPNPPPAIWTIPNYRILSMLLYYFWGSKGGEEAHRRSAEGGTISYYGERKGSHHPTSHTFHPLMCCPIYPIPIHLIPYFPQRPRPDQSQGQGQQ